VIRIEKLPRQWSLLFVLLWSALSALPALFAEHWFLTPECGAGFCFPIDGLYEAAPLYVIRCAWWVRLLPVAAMALLPVAAVVSLTAFRVLRERLRRRGPLAPLHARLTSVADGSLVRVRGRVRAPEGFTSRAGRPGVVVASSLVSRRDFSQRVYTAMPFRVLEAIDFHLVLAGGEEVQVQVAGMGSLSVPKPDRSLLDEVPRELGVREPGVMTHEEVVICHGDAVEVSGILGRQVDAGGEGGYRGGRLIPSLRSEGPVALAVHPLDEPFFAPDSSGALP
jgi:hypothetical protein